MKSRSASSKKMSRNVSCTNVVGRGAGAVSSSTSARVIVSVEFSMVALAKSAAKRRKSFACTRLPIVLNRYETQPEPENASRTDVKLYVASTDSIHGKRRYFDPT